MTREPKEPPSSLQKWNEVTPRDIVTELERLALVPAYYRPDMDSRKWSALYETYYEDLKGLSVEQLRDGCRRWRNNPENTKFPTPGQLREACRNPFESKPRRYDPLDDLPPALPPEVAKQIIEKTRIKYNFEPAGQEKTVEQIKAEILARPPIQPVPIPMTRERRNELLTHLKQALFFRYGERAIKYIAELPQ